jgi:hypothetical protein
MQLSLKRQKLHPRLLPPMMTTPGGNYAPFLHLIPLLICFSSGHTDASSSPSRQSNSNPFARKSSVGSPAPSASPLGVSPSPAPINPYVKSGGGVSVGRSSGLTISSAVEALIISPPSSASSNNGSARNGSDPAIVPPPTQSPATTKSNASTPRVREQYVDRRSDRETHHAAHRDDEISRRPVGHHRERRSQHHQQVQQHLLYDDPDVTPRSHHNANSRNPTPASSHTTTATNSDGFSFDERDVRKKTPRTASGSAPILSSPRNSGSETPLASSSSGFQKWKCENPKCLKWNTANPDYCDHCAFKRGATGARGATTKLYVGS